MRPQKAKERKRMAKKKTKSAKAPKTIMGIDSREFINEFFIALYCTLYADGKLPQPMIQRLEAIPGWNWDWERAASAYSTPIGILKQLVRECGDETFRKHKRQFLSAA
jgi:hypothetical protein